MRTPFLRLLWLALAGVIVAAVWRWVAPRFSAPAAPTAGTSARTEAAPLPVTIIRAESAPLRETVSAVGTLRANESVLIVSELSRRLTRVHAEEGARVQRGDLLFKLYDADLVAELAEIEARRRLAIANEQRSRELLKGRTASQQDYDRERAALDQVEAERAVKQALLAKTEIRAPFAGRIGIRRVSEGAWITPDTPLTTLQDLSHVKVDFSLPERYAESVRPGQVFTFSVTGLSNVFTGRVTVVEPVIDSASRSVQVRGLSQQPDERLLPGGFAAVSLELDDVRDGFLIPTEALVPSARGHGVYLVRGQVAELVPVDIGLRTPDRVQVLRGLSAGDQVIVTNLIRLRPGLTVRIASAATDATR